MIYEHFAATIQIYCDCEIYFKTESFLFSILRRNLFMSSGLCTEEINCKLFYSIYDTDY